MRSFKIYGIWPQASKQADIHTTSANTVMHASVGLAQACRNQQTLQCNIKYMLPYLFLKIEAPAYHKWWGTVALQPVADNQQHSGLVHERQCPFQFTTDAKCEDGTSSWCLFCCRKWGEFLRLYAMMKAGRVRTVECRGTQMTGRSN